MKKATGYGVFGGISVLADNPKRDPEEEERNEPKRFRPPDVISNLMNLAVNDAGPGIINQQFAINEPGLRQQDITFDRYYPKVRVLVKSFSSRINANEGQERDEAMLADLDTHKQYAEDHGFTFLPVVDGMVQREDLDRVKVGVKARQTGAEPVAAV